MHSHKNIHHPIIKNCYGTVRSTLTMQKSPYLKDWTHWRIWLLPNNIGGGAWQVILYTTDYTELFTSLVSYIKLTEIQPWLSNCLLCASREKRLTLCLKWYEFSCWVDSKGCWQWMHFSLSNEATCECISECECTRVNVWFLKEMKKLRFLC